MTCDEAMPLLNAHLDSELESASETTVQSHLALCPSCVAELRKLEHVRDAVRSVAGLRRAPESLHRNLRLALRGAGHPDWQVPRRIDWRSWGAIAAGVTLIALAVLPFVTTARNERRLIAAELLSAHQRALTGRDIDVVSSDRHTVKPWFNGRLPFSPPVVDLAAQGFPLEGGRVDFAGGHAVAALVYARRLHHIDVFIWPSGGTEPPGQFGRDGFNETAWQKGGFTFAAVSDLNAEELDAFAEQLRR